MGRKNITLSKEHGLNPVIPLCVYCDQPKNKVAVLGAAGDKLARELGHKDGQMPMHAWIPGDFTPCDDCLKKGGVGVVAVGPNREVEGVWLIIGGAAERVFRPSDLERFERERYIPVTKEAAERIGLLKRKEDEDGK